MGLLASGIGLASGGLGGGASLPPIGGSAGPAVSRGGSSGSGNNVITVGDSGLNVGAIVNALAGSQQSGALPIQLANGMARPISSINAEATIGGSKLGFDLSLAPLLLIGAGVVGFLLLRK